MKPKHVEDERLNALQALMMCHIPVGADFHTLSQKQTAALLDYADQVRYQRPRNANGSRARYFHDMLQRRAQRKD